MGRVGVYREHYSGKSIHLGRASVWRGFVGKHGLTTQQWHVVTKLGQGKSRAEVAEMMGISVNTGKAYWI